MLMDWIHQALGGEEQLRRYKQCVEEFNQLLQTLFEEQSVQPYEPDCSKNNTKTRPPT